jgi:hypothetical protein
LNGHRQPFAFRHIVLLSLHAVRAAALLVLLAGGGCQGVLGLERYTFDGGSGGTGGTSAGGGAAGDTGAGGSVSPAGGAGGSGVIAGAGGENAAGAGGTASGGSSPDAGADGGAEEQGCGASDRCVPPIPVGWQGPIVVGASGGGCPSGYPTAVGQVYADFQAGTANCGCNCLLTGVTCQLLSSNGDFFEPAVECDSPPVTDDCLSAVSVATCSVASTESEITPSAFQTTRLSCSGAAAGAASTGGTFYPAGGGFGSVCVSAIGNVACPSGFPQQTVYFQNIADDRACSACSCGPVGQACQIEIEVCSVAEYNVTMNEGDECTQLSSGDGDGVTRGEPTVVQQGTCAAVGGVLQGSTAPSDPITVCCME